MSIKRVRSGSFTTVNNSVLNDERLSAEALGVLAYLLGKPHDWTVMPANLANRFDCGRDRIYRILKELIDAGYIFRSQGRSDETKSFEKIGYEVRDLIANPLPENTEAAPDLSEKPLPEKPYTEKPLPGNQTLQKKESTKELELEMTESTNIALTRIDWPADYEEIFWSKYPNKKSKAHALKALGKIARGGKVQWGDLLAGLERYIISETVQRGFVKHPATWLNGRCWEDEEQTTPRTVERPVSFFEIATGKAW